MTMCFNRSRASRLAVLALALAPVFGAGSSASAQITFTTTLDDPQSRLFNGQALLSSLNAAGQVWARRLFGTARIDIVVSVADPAFIPTAAGFSRTSGFVANRGGFDVFEQGAAFKIRTGVDPNDAVEDVVVLINPDYANFQLWNDPQPSLRTAEVPIFMTDAISLFTHELAHAFSMNAFINSFDGTYPGTFRSTYDEFVSYNGTDFFFNGPRATTRYGGPVPLTYGAVVHLGNQDPRPGSDLLSDLMNGVSFPQGVRQFPSELDLAIVKDTGVAVRPNCPADFNYDGVMNVMDIFAYLQMWFARHPTADANDSGTVAVDDIFRFLSVWFSRCA